MGMFDQFKGVADKAKKLVGQHGDKLDPLVDKAGDLVDKKTGDKYKGKVDSAQAAAKKAIRKQQGR